MGPAVVKLQRMLQSSGIQKPQTAHEAWFKKHYLHRVQAIIASLQTPSADTVAQPERVVEALKGIVKSVSSSVRFAF